MGGAVCARTSRGSSIPRSFPGSAPAYVRGHAGQEWRRGIPGGAGRRTAAEVPSHRGRDQRGLRPGREAGTFQAPGGIRPQGGLHGHQDLPLREGRREDRSEVQLLRGPERRSALQDWFERMAESAQHRIDAGPGRQVRPAGRGRGAESAGFRYGSQAVGGAGAVPADSGPDRKNETYMHTARAQAAAIAEAIRKTQP